MLSSVVELFRSVVGHVVFIRSLGFVPNGCRAVPLLAGAQVDGGRVHLLNQTFFEGNTGGESGAIALSPAGALDYTLPAPPGRWLFVRQGKTFQLDPGATGPDFPYACPAGVVGGSLPEEQSGPQCSRLW